MNNKKLKKMLLFKKKKNEKNLGSQIIQSKSIKEYGIWNDLLRNT